MNTGGLLLLSRFASPPNLLSLCGPEKQKGLNWYAQTGEIDQGTVEILKEFQTAYPYLQIIAQENDLADPFHPLVVEAYWLGNKLLRNVSMLKFGRFLTETLSLKRKINNKSLALLFSKLPKGAFPHHSFHVVNIYQRTGNLTIPQTIETMEACLINWGKIINIQDDKLDIKTQKLVINGNKLVFGPNVIRTIKNLGDKDIFASKLKVNDWVSYHWGRFCLKLNPFQLKNLVFYTNLSLKLSTQS